MYERLQQDPAPLLCHRQDCARWQRDTPMTVPGRNRGTPFEYEVKTPVADVAPLGIVSTSYTREADVTYSTTTIPARFAEGVFALTVMTRLFHIARVIPSPVARSWKGGFIGRLWARFASPFTESVFLFLFTVPPPRSAREGCCRQKPNEARISLASAFSA